MDLNFLKNIEYGMYIIGARSIENDRLNAFVCNTCIQITSNPVSVLISVNKNNFTYELIKKSGYFSVSVINDKADLMFIGYFGFRTGKEINKFDKNNIYEYKIFDNGTPVILSNINSIFEVKVNYEIDRGSHVVFLGDILKGEVISNDKTMTYNFYHNVLKGKTAKNAPTYNN